MASSLPPSFAFLNPLFSEYIQIHREHGTMWTYWPKICSWLICVVRLLDRLIHVVRDSNMALCGLIAQRFVPLSLVRSWLMCVVRLLDRLIHVVCDYVDLLPKDLLPSSFVRFFSSLYFSSPFFGVRTGTWRMWHYLHSATAYSVVTHIYDSWPSVNIYTAHGRDQTSYGECCTICTPPRLYSPSVFPFFLVLVGVSLSRTRYYVWPRFFFPPLRTTFVMNTYLPPKISGLNGHSLVLTKKQRMVFAKCACPSFVFWQVIHYWLQFLVAIPCCKSTWQVATWLFFFGCW